MVKVRSSMQWWGAVGSVLLGVVALVVAPPAIGIAVLAASVALVVFWLWRFVRRAADGGLEAASVRHLHVAGAASLSREEVRHVLWVGRPPAT